MADEKVYPLRLTHDEAVELAALLGSQPAQLLGRLYSIFDILTDKFPGDIKYPPYQEALEKIRTKKRQISQL